MKKFKNALLAISTTSAILLGSFSASIATIGINNTKIKATATEVNPSHRRLSIGLNAYDLDTNTGDNPQLSYGNKGILTTVVDTAKKLYLIYVNDKTGEIEWSLNNLNDVMSIIYYPNVSVPFFTVLLRDNSDAASGATTVTIKTIRESDGHIMTSQKVDGIYTDGGNLFFSQCSNDPYRLVISDKNLVETSTRRFLTREVMVNKNGTLTISFNETPEVHEDTNKYFMPSAGSVYFKGSYWDINMLISEAAPHRISFKIYRDWKEVYKWDTAFDYKNIAGSIKFDLVAVKSLPNNLWVSGQGNSIKFATFKIGEHPLVFSASYDIRQNKLDTSGTRTLTKNSAFPYDNSIASFDVSGNEFTILTLNDCSLITGNFNNINNLSYFNWRNNHESNRIKLYSTLKDSIIPNFILNKISTSSNGNIALTEYASLFFVNPSYNNGNGGWGYQTDNYKKITTKLVAKGKEKTQLTNNMINNLSETLRQNGFFDSNVNNAFVNVNTDSAYSFEPINFDDNTQYKGSVDFRLKISNSYVNGNLGTYTYPQIFTLSGYKSYTTNLSLSNYSQESFKKIYSWDLSNDEIIKRVKSNLSTMIVDLPTGTDLNKINVSVSDGYFGNYKTVTITVPQYFSRDNKLVNSPTSLSFTLEGFNFDTNKLLSIILPIIFVIILGIVVGIVLHFKHKKDEVVEQSHIEKMLSSDWWY